MGLYGVAVDVQTKAWSCESGISGCLISSLFGVLKLDTID
jgi:hypothetical protein